MTQSQLEILIKARDMASSVLGKVRGSLQAMNNTAGAVARDGLLKLQNGFKATTTAMMIGLPLLGGLLGGLGLKAINTAGKYETLNVALETSLGSAEAAKDAFKIINEFAAKTPYQLQEVTTAFVKLKNMGLDNSIEALTSYGDTASAMGKGLNDMIEAVADAATGEFERLKEFGIRASSEGDKVSFTFKGITTTVGKNAAEIEDYLIKLGKANFAGGMAKQAETLGGKLSTLKDTFDLTMASFANDTGLLDWAKSGIDAASNLLSGIKPLYDLIVKGDYTGGLNDAFGWAEDSEIVDNILTIRDNIIGLTSSISNFVAQSGLAEPVLVGLAGVISTLVVGALLSMAAAAVAATWPFILLGTVVAGLYYVWQQHSDVIQGFLEGAWNNLQAAFKFFAEVIWPQYLQPALKDLGDAWNSISPILMDLWYVISNYVAPIIGFIAGVVILGAIIAFRNFAATIKEWAENARITWDYFKDQLESLGQKVDWLAKVMSWAWKQIQDSVESSVNFFIAPIKDAIYWMNQLYNAAASAFNMQNKTNNTSTSSKGGTFAMGGVFDGGVQKFASGGVVSSPTYFGMRGGMGLMGEAGPEAIMPLTRGSDGKLGVKAQGTGNNQNIVINLSVGFLNGTAADAREMARMLTPHIQKYLKNN